MEMNELSLRKKAGAKLKRAGKNITAGAKEFKSKVKAIPGDFKKAGKAFKALPKGSKATIIGKGLAAGAVGAGLGHLASKGLNKLAQKKKVAKNESLGLSILEKLDLLIEGYSLNEIDEPENDGGENEEAADAEAEATDESFLGEGKAKTVINSLKKASARIKKTKIVKTANDKLKTAANKFNKLSTGKKVATGAAAGFGGAKLIHRRKKTR